MLFFVFVGLTFYLWGLIGTYNVIKPLFDEDNKMKNFFLISFWPITMFHGLMKLTTSGFFKFILRQFNKLKGPQNPFKSDIIERPQPGRPVDKLEWETKKKYDHLIVSMRLFVKDLGIVIEYSNGVMVETEEDIYQAIRILREYVSKKMGQTALTNIDTIYLNTEDILQHEKNRWDLQNREED